MSDASEAKPTDRFLPWLFVLFFVVVLAVNGVMVYVAASSWTGIETKQHYIKGRDYNQTIEAVERQKARGWESALTIAPQDKGRIRIDLNLSDAGKRVIAGADISARFVRPTHEGHDVEIRLDDYGAGRYVGELVAPLPGQWDVHVTARHPSGDFRITRRVVVP